MALALLLFSGAVLVIAGLAIAWPLLFQRIEPYMPARAESTPFSERDALLEAIGELEIEYQSGKLSEADYQAAKSRYEREYVRIARLAGASPG
jgi:hypothetical protein